MLEIKNIWKSYQDKTLLHDISFTVAAGETICLLGPSGSGKSTLLRIISGLEDPDQGQVLWSGEDLESVPAHRRDFGLVFQDYALFPHLTVAGNVSFGLNMLNLPKKEIDQRIVRLLDKVSLAGFEGRKVTDLSGGEQQRVALARALAPDPRLLMFDEPLGALDRNLREQLMAELRSILRLGGLPAIYVTHDQEEAFYLADRVLLLHEGTIVRDGTPADIWSDPGSAWAARFLDAGNVLAGVILSTGRVKTSIGILPLDCRHDHIASDEINLMISKRGAKLVTLSEITGKVTDVVFSQDGYKITLENGPEFYLPNAPKAGQTIFLEIPTIEIKCLS